MYKNIKPYPPELQKLLTFNGFLAEFYKQLKNHSTDQESYQAVEELHETYFGKRKYASYHVFIVVRARNKNK